MSTKFKIKYDMLEGRCEKRGFITFVAEDPTNPRDSEGIKRLERLLKLCHIYGTKIEVRGPNLCTSIPLEAVTSAVLEDDPEHLCYQFIDHEVGTEFPHERVQDAILHVFTGECPGFREVPNARDTQGSFVMYIVTNRIISTEEIQKLWSEEIAE